VPGADFHQRFVDEIEQIVILATRSQRRSTASSRRLSKTAELSSASRRRLTDE